MVVSSPNALVALSFSVRFTTHCVVFCCRPVFTEVTSVPSKTALSSTYLVPLASQETIWLLMSSHWAFCRVYPTVAFQLSSTVLGLGPGLHTIWSNSFLVCALTLLGSPKVVADAGAVEDGLALAAGVAVAFADVLAVGVAVGLALVVACCAETAAADALAVALALAVAEGLAVADALGVAAGEPLGLAAVREGACPVYGCSSSTARKFSLAVALTKSMTSCAALPGTVTLIRSPPCCCTWAPEFPVPFTRDSRTEIACCMEPLDGGWPFGVTALSTTWVPLDRSRPRPTLNCECHLSGWNVSLPRMEISMIRMITPSAASARTGREALLLGGATVSLPVESSLNRSAR